MIAPNLQTLAQLFSGRVLNTMIEGIAIAGLSWLVLRFIAVESAVSRFAIWFSTLLAVVLMPFLMRNSRSLIFQRNSVQFPSSWATYLFFAWAAIAGLLLVRLSFSLWHVWQLRRHCRSIEAAHPDLRDTIRRHSGRRTVRLLVSDNVRVPTALGFFRPAIVLPAWMLDQVSPNELNAVLLHELAHLRRWDDWTNLAQKVLKAIFFFHPAVWFIESRLALEREMACDEFVLEQTANAGSYAASLISLAERALSENSRLRRPLALAQSAIGHMRQMSRRIAQILKPGRVPASKPWRSVLAAGSVLTIAFAATPYAPEMVLFRSAAPSLSAVADSAPAVAVEPTMRVPAIRASLKVPVARTQTNRPARIVPARTKLRHSAKPKVVLTRAKVEQQPAPMLLLFQSTHLNGLGAPVWKLTLWRLTAGPNGTAQIEETIVMNSI